MTAAVLLVLSSLLSAQEGALDVLDGETLYEDGWLITAGYEFRTRRGLLDGDERIGDPFHQREFHHAAVLSAHYGVLHTLQVGTVIPYVSRELETSGGRLSSDGL